MKNIKALGFNYQSTTTMQPNNTLTPESIIANFLEEYIYNGSLDPREWEFIQSYKDIDDVLIKIDKFGTQQFLAGQEAGKREAEWSDEKKREFAYKVWIASANSFRLYPNNKHTFSDFYSSFAPESIEAEESNLKEK